MYPVSQSEHAIPSDHIWQRARNNKADLSLLVHISREIADIVAIASRCRWDDSDRYDRWSMFSATVWFRSLVLLSSAILHQRYRRRWMWISLWSCEAYRCAASVAFRLHASRNWSNKAESSVKCFSAFANARSSLRKSLSNRSISWCLTLRAYWMERGAQSHPCDRTKITLLAKRISPDWFADNREDSCDFDVGLHVTIFKRLQQWSEDVTLKMCYDPWSISIGQCLMVFFGLKTIEQTIKTTTNAHLPVD